MNVCKVEYYDPKGHTPRCPRAMVESVGGLIPAAMRLLRLFDPMAIPLRSHAERQVSTSQIFGSHFPVFVEISDVLWTEELRGIPHHRRRYYN